MIKEKKIACIIPARLRSTRFPEKILKNLRGKPILEWVWRGAKKIKLFDDVVFAIDAEKTADLIKAFGGKFVMTSQNCNSGTDRLVEIIHRDLVSADIFVNWQADEPFITPQMILELLQDVEDDKLDAWTLKKKIVSQNEILDPNVAKVVCDQNNLAMYFSRSPIPYHRNPKDCAPQKYYKHVGIYAYTIGALRKIGKMNINCYIEKAEKLEQLRFLYNNLKIKVHETDVDVIGIDTLKDLKRAEIFAAKLDF